MTTTKQQIFMKIQKVIGISIFLGMVSCQKSKVKPTEDTGDPAGVDLGEALSTGNIYNRWIITDDDADHAEQTRNTQFFSGKLNPSIQISGNGDYTFHYNNGNTNLPVDEKGSWFADPGNVLTFEGSRIIWYNQKNTSIADSTVRSRDVNNYKFLVNKLTEENLVLTSLRVRQHYTGKELILNQVDTLRETLFLTDND